MTSKCGVASRLSNGAVYFAILSTLTWCGPSSTNTQGEWGTPVPDGAGGRTTAREGGIVFHSGIVTHIQFSEYNSVLTRTLSTSG